MKQKDHGAVSSDAENFTIFAFNFGAVSAVHQTPKISVSQLSLVQLVQLVQFQVQFKKAKIIN